MDKLPTALAFPIILGAGILGQNLAGKLWEAIFDEEPPDTAEQEMRIGMLLLAAVVEGTMYKLLRMAADRALRQAVLSSSGNWPGEHGEGE